jgi:hypothetical protein
MLSDRLTAAQHEFHHAMLSTLHVHLAPRSSSIPRCVFVGSGVLGSGSPRRCSRAALPRRN